EIRPDLPAQAALSLAQQANRKRGEYARAALETGLQLQAQLGVNPFKYGMAGGSDTHTGLAAIEEDNFGDADGSSLPRGTRLARKYSWRLSSSFYNAVAAT